MRACVFVLGWSFVVLSFVLSAEDTSSDECLSVCSFCQTSVCVAGIVSRFVELAKGRIQIRKRLPPSVSPSLPPSLPPF